MEQESTHSFPESSMISASVGFNTALCFAQGYLFPLFLKCSREGGADVTAHKPSRSLNLPGEGRGRGVSINLQHYLMSAGEIVVVC